MVLQILTSIGYDIVQATWRTATLAVPVFLVLKIAQTYLGEGLKMKNLEESLIEDSRTFVALLTLAGSLSILFGAEVPRFRVIGDFFAVIYFGFLFWKF